MIKIDDGYTILNDKLRGRKPKFKLEKDGKKYIYKYGAINSEIWAEVIAEQLGLQAGIDMAHYEIATYQDTIGVLTDYFLQPHEYIISSDNLRSNVQTIYDENNVHLNLEDNTIGNIVTAASMYDDRVDPESLALELMIRWCFYGGIIEGDKNATNIAFIKGLSALRITPDYDNSSMAGLNKNIQHMIDALRRGQSVYSYTDGMKTDLKASSADTGYFLSDFDNFSKKYPYQCSICMERLSNIDVDAAIERVEEINGVEVPWDIKYWVSKTINSRIADMKSIYERNKVDGDNKPFVKTKKEPK